jgi:hypothetical protein
MGFLSLTFVNRGKTRWPMHNMRRFFSTVKN